MLDYPDTMLLLLDRRLWLADNDDSDSYPLRGSHAIINYCEYSRYSLVVRTTVLCVVILRTY